MIVVSNRIPVAPGQEASFAERFRSRAGLVEGHNGFLRLEILKPTQVTMRGRVMGRSAYHVVLTYWKHVEDFVAWTIHASKPTNVLIVPLTKKTYKCLVSYIKVSDNFQK